MNVTSQRMCLMAMRHRWADEMYQGAKTVEFRKGCVPPAGTMVFVYESAPVQRITGTFMIVAALEGPVAKVWSDAWRLELVGSLKLADLVDYSGGKDMPLRALIVGVPLKFRQPLKLPSGTRPPQSWQWLSGPIRDLAVKHLDAEFWPLDPSEIPA